MFTVTGAKVENLATTVKGITKGIVHRDLIIPEMMHNL